MDYLETKKNFLLENGGEIKDLKIAYHTYGKINSDQSNVIWVFHAISGSSDVMDWWPGLFGRDCHYDPAQYFIVCANTIGSPYGSSHPTNKDFPQFSMRDVVRAHQQLAEELCIERIHTAIGASFGGNQALEFAYSFKGTIEHLILIASCARESAWGIAIHEAQRLAIESDPSFGRPDGGQDGMRAARSMAMLNYRTADAFIAQQTDVEEKVDDFNASSYIRYQGDKFVDRFNALSYHYLTKCLDSHHIGRGRGGESRALGHIKIPTLVIGFDTDTLIPIRLQRHMAEHIPHSHLEEITSQFGHDGFLVETKVISEKIGSFHERLSSAQEEVQRVVLKFGGKSLVDDQLSRLAEIISTASQGNSIAVVVSARGVTTDRLVGLFDSYLKGGYPDDELEEFFDSQQIDGFETDLSKEFNELRSLLHLVADLKLKDTVIMDRVMAYGEQLSAKVLVHYLGTLGLDRTLVDSGDILFLEEENGELSVDLSRSERKTRSMFSCISADCIPVVTGFYGRDEQGRIRTLGRNGTNYSATLIAKFIQAKEVQNWTNVSGIFSADPAYVDNAQQIPHMSYREANELANFGTNVLHPRTILPLMNSEIPLRILNTSEPSLPGTRVDKEGSGKGVKAVSVVDDVSLVKIEGKGLSGRVGIDGRIFNVLSDSDISVRIISQASSERGIGFVVDSTVAFRAEQLLVNEFEKEILANDISSIEVENDMAIIAIVGRHNYALEKAIQGLRRNKVWMHLISNSMSGEHISLVIKSSLAKKAVRVVHNQVMGAVKVIHVFAIGKGTVGARFIDQIIETHEELEQERNLRIRVIGVADSKRFYLDPQGLQPDWRAQLQAASDSNDLSRILNELQASHLENIVVVDNSSSQDIAMSYPAIIKSGFDLVASNKKGNSSSQEIYTELRKLLKRKGRSFFYETNVGAGLPLIDTIKQLRDSADKIERIRGVFSGSLSYLFNTFCAEDHPFCAILNEAEKNGLTEPDPREDLSGKDVARKLLILAREIGMQFEFEGIEINGLVPEKFQVDGDYRAFLENEEGLNDHYARLKETLASDMVLRYVGELDVVSRSLKVSLDVVEVSTPLGSLKNADSLFEIYTSSYGEHPIVIQGAGAGAEVTARGVYSDLIKIGLQA